jgi:hypothetical protein
VQKKVLVQIAERAEPAEADREKNHSRDVTEQEVSQPTASRVFARKPNRGDQRRERDPAKPALIERRKTEYTEHSARRGRKPRPEFF